jgi:spore cortex biosynthesis protein YabQ
MAMMSMSGVLLGIVFDAYRVVCGQLRVNRWILSLLDLVYWAFATVFVFRVLYYSNQGQLRFFVFLGLIVGTLLYFWLISSITIQIVLWLIRVIQALFNFGVRCFEVLIIMPLRGLYRLVMILFGFLVAITIFLYKIVLQLLSPFAKLFWRLLRPLHKRMKLPRWAKRGVQWVLGIWRRLF